MPHQSAEIFGGLFYRTAEADAARFCGAAALGLPFYVGSGSILLAFFFSAMVGIGFGFYPAWRASLLNPIDALKYE